MTIAAIAEPHLPVKTRFVEADGLLTWPAQGFLQALTTQSYQGIPLGQYLLATADAGLPNAVNLGALVSGFLSIVVTTGVAVVTAAATIAASVLVGPLPAISGAALTALTGANIVHSLVTKAFADTGYVAALDQTVNVNATAGATTIKLPPLAALVSGCFCIVKKIDASGNAVTIDGNGQTIDGATTKALAAQWNALLLQTDGSNWFEIGKI